MAFALLDHTEEKTTIDEILTGTFREKDRQINFAIEELEKIKKEIEQDAFKDVNGSKYIFVNRINQIIDKYKTELKGESNAE